ncbi:DUF4367 domain-containing protein [Paenibacillus alginolyticus]|uniref:DUF4367 domain-containing protein n=1 Tax=Paenibacillus alginolyticus TaxID=59839 RepID=A0ABT4GIN3_9BACL|nr:DUF4367 domain-containing protein [Paenibacillus alginolyticus]MCY9664961.1 DUF4367 domain-containing protein [Paenibacillus alginolyticus]MCY9696064.1 DUF4367 domain-containing protein [Paenibacillus alginolyticus]MEC0147488.1 DUF4367 domain-containing protein [Paenibacillus alginolyticus]
MNPHTEKLSDSELKQAVKSAYDDITIPGGTLAWERMQEKISVQSKKRRQYTQTLRFGIAVVIVTLVIGLVIPTSSAFAFQKLFTIVKKAQNGVVQVLYGTQKNNIQGARTVPPPGYDAVRINENSDQIVQPLVTSLEEANKKLSFHIAVPSILPANYNMERVKLFPDDDKEYHYVLVEYRKNDEFILLSEKKLIEKSTGWKSTITETAGRIVPVEVGGYEGILIEYTEGGARIEWLKDNILFEIYGKLNGDEMLELAQSLK